MNDVLAEWADIQYFLKQRCFVYSERCKARLRAPLCPSKEKNPLNPLTLSKPASAILSIHLVRVPPNVVTKEITRADDGQHHHC